MNSPKGARMNSQILRPELSFELLRFSVFFMTGVIWLVQVVHYPLMRFVRTEDFAHFHALHSAHITWIVGPCMLLQIGASFLVGFYYSTWIHGVLSVGVFASTALISVPLHQILSRGWNSKAHQRLVLSNWVRTALWTGHALWLLQS